ncbi:MAG: DUF4163 domain-containing protein [Bacteroidia bacterium]|nr:DUF4163 domain-containing protein [Bacteroidia bacterium]NND12131.1 DUF4163 domain-containing protein [Flavobacteriaceae bacterium]NNK28369.1 DUF4163 domain-containing protein [Flavobacteriaceae bacterium]RZV64352.1 MAG: DUF4163 domain-containing protein [Flavobacteriaceae bacterium]
MRIRLFTILVLILVVACEEETYLTFSESNFTSEEHAIVEVNMPLCDGNSEVASKINASINSHVANSLNPLEKDPGSNSIEEMTKLFDKEFIAFSNDVSDVSQPWEAFVDGELIYQSPEVISIAFNAYKNTGGAHGNSVISFLNFNPNDGEVYNLEDVVNDLKGFTDLARTYFLEEIKSTTESSEITISSVISLPEAIGVSDDGVILVYNSFELTDYSIPLLEFTIPFEEASKFLKVD